MKAKMGFSFIFQSMKENFEVTTADKDSCTVEGKGRTATVDPIKNIY